MSPDVIFLVNLNLFVIMPCICFVILNIGLLFSFGLLLDFADVFLISFHSAVSASFNQTDVEPNSFFTSAKSLLAKTLSSYRSLYLHSW